MGRFKRISASAACRASTSLRIVLCAATDAALHALRFDTNKLGVDSCNKLNLHTVSTAHRAVSPNHLVLPMWQLPWPAPHHLFCVLRACSFRPLSTRRCRASPSTSLTSRKGIRTSKPTRRRPLTRRRRSPFRYGLRCVNAGWHPLCGRCNRPFCASLVALRSHHLVVLLR